MMELQNMLKHETKTRADTEYTSNFALAFDSGARLVSVVAVLVLLSMSRSLSLLPSRYAHDFIWRRAVTLRMETIGVNYATPAAAADSIVAPRQSGSRTNAEYEPPNGGGFSVVRRVNNAKSCRRHVLDIPT